jgi:hypothetical protein
MTGYSNKPLLAKLGPAVDGRAMVVFFTSSRGTLIRRFSRLARSVHPDGALWVAALDDVWSGLKFVFRLKDRPLTLRRGGTRTQRAGGGRKPGARLTERKRIGGVHRGERLAIS